MNGFFSQEALEALQQAYELQLTPDEMDIDQTTGLPTNQVSNTSPWHNQVELWKYPDGKTPTKPGEILYIRPTGEEEEEEMDDEDYEYLDEEEVDTEYEEDEVDESMSEEEVDALIEELLSSEDED
jgi:hypothetical protein